MEDIFEQYVRHAEAYLEVCNLPEATPEHYLDEIDSEKLSFVFKVLSIILGSIGGPLFAYSFFTESFERLVIGAVLLVLALLSLVIMMLFKLLGPIQRQAAEEKAQAFIEDQVEINKISMRTIREGMNLAFRLSWIALELEEKGVEPHEGEKLRRAVARLKEQISRTI